MTDRNIMQVNGHQILDIKPRLWVRLICEDIQYISNVRLVMGCPWTAEGAAQAGALNIFGEPMCHINSSFIEASRVGLYCHIYSSVGQMMGCPWAADNGVQPGAHNIFCRTHCYRADVLREISCPTEYN